METLLICPSVLLEMSMYVQSIPLPAEDYNLFSLGKLEREWESQQIYLLLKQGPDLLLFPEGYLVPLLHQ